MENTPQPTFTQLKKQFEEGTARMYREVGHLSNEWFEYLIPIYIHARQADRTHSEAVEVCRNEMNSHYVS